MRSRFGVWAALGLALLAFAACGGDDGPGPGSSGAGGATGPGGMGGTGAAGGGQGGEGGQGGQGGGSSAGLSFVVAGSYPASVGGGNSVMAGAHVNGDGLLDLVVLNTVGVFVSVLVADPGGGYQETARRYLDVAPSDLAVGDLDGDGLVDAAVTDAEGGLSIFLGQAGGALQPPATYATPLSWAGGVEAADLDADGDLDLVVGSRFAESIHVFLGNGDGTFPPPQAVGVAGDHSLSDVAAAHVDGDGLLDVVASDERSASAYLFKGTGGGALAAAVSIPAQHAQSIALGDLTGDGRPEILLGASFDANSLGLLVNDGAGAFQPLVTHAAGSRPRVLALADLTGDGLRDVLAVESGWPGNSLQILRNLGGGALMPAEALAAGRRPRAAVVSDADGDLVPDLIAGNDAPGLSVLAGNGDGTFQAPAGQGFGAGAREIAVGDLDGDGATEVVFGAGLSAAVTVLHNDGAGALSEVASYALGDDPFRLFLVNVDADPALDLVAVNGCSFAFCSVVETLSGLGDGALSQPVSSAMGAIFTDAAAADLDGDGDGDLLVTEGHDGSLMRCNGDGTFTQEMGAYVVAFGLADFDGDSVLDMAAASEGYTFVGRGLGDGSFVWNSQGYLGSAQRIATGDLNNDGSADFLGVPWLGDTITLMFGAGDAMDFTPAVLDLNSEGILSPVVADLDGNGWSDLALIAGGRVVVLLNGENGFKDGPVIQAGRDPSALAVADLNGDARPDLLVTYAGSNELVVLINAP